MKLPRWVLILLALLPSACVVATPRPPPPRYQPPPPPPRYDPPRPAPRYVPPPIHASAISEQRAVQIAMGYARSQRLTVHKVKKVSISRQTWVVELQLHPPTPGKLEVGVDALNGRVVWADSDRDEGHGHGKGHDDGHRR